MDSIPLQHLASMDSTKFLTMLLLLQLFLLAPRATRVVVWIYSQVLRLFQRLLCQKKDKPTDLIPGPLALPLFGASWLYSSLGPYTHAKYHESNADKYRRYGPVVREEVLWNFPLIHLFDKQDIETVLCYKSEYPQRPHNEADVFYRLSRPDLYRDVGMVNENGPKWHRLRQELTPPLTNRKTPHHYAAHMNLIADDLVAVIGARSQEAGGVLHGFKPLVYRAGLEMVCNVALERRMGYLDDHIGHDMQAIMDAIRGYQAASNEAMFGLPWWKYVPAAFSGVFTQLVKHKDTLFNSIGRLVDEALMMPDEPEDSKSILRQLLRNPKLPVMDVKASVVDYITAGVDTIGNSVIFVVALIAQHPKVMRRLQKELVAHRADCELSPDTLQSMRYLRACVKESFRVYPTASQIARITEADLQMACGLNVPRGSVVLCHHHIACMQECNFTRADQFVPERWLEDERARGWNHEPSLVMPFGAGKRSCPGKRLAEQEIYIITAKLFHTYNLRLTDALSVEFNFLLTPSGPLDFEVSKRTTTTCNY